MKINLWTIILLNTIGTILAMLGWTLKIFLMLLIGFPILLFSAYYIIFIYKEKTK